MRDCREALSDPASAAPDGAPRPLLKQTETVSKAGSNHVALTPLATIAFQSGRPVERHR